ncbi:hypothetical protein J2X36_004397 [Methylobacterium sp. BE186]|uniref:hypothetical protein n=1 Tax=Methylobacterium sp. BE186 TaxID=2817715 RepID=UPI00285B6935|nr:hypothetical protein [Methylobacterium sp. BE186]MDR7039621.1 hypothetical protein [Methylobacterium sp. BE186]
MARPVMLPVRWKSIRSGKSSMSSARWMKQGIPASELTQPLDPGAQALVAVEAGELVLDTATAFPHG